MCNFTSNFAPFLYSVQKMLTMQDDLKLKKGFKIVAISLIESRFPRHFELHVETDEHKHFVQLMEQNGESEIISCSSFTPVLPPSERLK